MLTKIRTSLIILFLIAALSPLMAQPGDDSPLMPDKSLADILGLTEEQIEALQQLTEEFEAAAGPLQEEKAAAREALAAELEAEEPSAALVGELFLQIQGLNGQIEQLRLDFTAAFEALLTPEQLERLQRLRERRRHRRLHDRLADSGDRPSGFFPGRVLARLLDLSEEQVTQLQELQEELQTTVQPLREERGLLHDQLELLLESDAPNAEEVGALVIAIHEVNQQIEQAQQDFTASFEAILTAEQLEKLQEFLDNPRRGPRGRPDRASR